jgi:hypothetical protein
MEGRGVACRAVMVGVLRGAVPVRLVTLDVRDRSQEQDQRYGGDSRFHHFPGIIEQAL